VRKSSTPVVRRHPISVRFRSSYLLLVDLSVEGTHSQLQTLDRNGPYSLRPKTWASLTVISILVRDNPPVRPAYPI